MDIFSVIKLIAGLTFFLFGMKVMSSDLEKLAGGKLENMLGKATANPLLSMLLGLVITVAVQSSSASTVMLVGLVNSGIMQFSQTVYVIFGANIGTTLTAWILSLSGIESESMAIQLLKPEYFSPVIAFVGIIFVMFSKNNKKQSVGTVFVGFSVLMYGMVFMKDAVSPLAELPQFADMLVRFNNPLFGVLAGTVVTAVIQSSAASVGILQALALTGSISVGMAIPIVMGQNIGTCVTALISAVGAKASAKRVAFVHTAINVIGTVIFLIGFGAVQLIFHPALFTSPASALGIALIHTVFNVGITIILMPATKLLVKFTEKLVKTKDKPEQKDKHVFTLDERLLRSPSVAVRECVNYTVIMSEIASDMILTSFSILCEYDKKTDIWLNEQENKLDALEDDVGTYLVRLSTPAISDEDSRTIARMLHVIGNFERLGDHAVNLLKTSNEIHEKKIIFSENAYAELQQLTDAVIEILTLAAKAYRDNDTVLAFRVEPLEQVIDVLVENSRKNHIKRVQNGECTIALGFVFSDILTNCERISDHCSNVAVAVIETEHDSFDTHKYLNGVKYSDSGFDEIYDEFSRKYLTE